MKNIFCSFAACFLSNAVFLLADLQAAETTKVAPAKIQNQVKEGDLTTLALTPDAVRRLGIELAPVVLKKVDSTRFFGGEVVLPATFQNSVGEPATNITGSSVFALLPSLSSTEMVRLAESQIDAEAQVEKARIQLQAAKTVMDRNEQLLASKSGSVKNLDDARTQFSLAELAVKSARARRELLGPSVLNAQNPNRVWIRVPVYAGDFPKLNSSQEAGVSLLGESSTNSPRMAQPIAAPPSANPNAGTMDLVYELKNDDQSLRVGQKVGVTIRLNSSTESLVIPASAIVHDIHGGTWVYENLKPDTYARRRVAVRSVSGSEAILSSGPKVGTRIVITGVAELFGTEFGIGK